MPNRAHRLAHMDITDILWRTGAAGRVAIDRVRSSIARSASEKCGRAPGWDRRHLRHVLAPLPSLSAAAAAARAERWDDAHRALARHFADAPQRFVIAPMLRTPLTDRIRREYPDSSREAAARADRVIAGEYDLLGYRGLRFGSTDTSGPARENPRIDWHLDPVHGCRTPMQFWASVPFLDPSCGDHKIIWELNRHQHWLRLGRAYWLTGNATYRDACLWQLDDWLAANPPLIGVNWASMLELGLRSLSWIWALNFFADPNLDDRSPWIVDLLVGLDRQLAHVERNLSYYFSPNTHLLGEALALYVAGRTLPELKASRRRESLGRRILVAEIERQITADGGHCERSAHYHRYTLDFYLMALAVARITRDPVAPRFEEAVARLGFAARLLADNDGRLPHIGDDDAGMLMPMCGRAFDDIRDSLAAAAALAGRPGLRVRDHFLFAWGPTPRPDALAPSRSGVTFSGRAAHHGSSIAARPPEETLWLLAHPTLDTLLELSQLAPPGEPIASAALPATGYHVSRTAAGDHLVIDAGPHGYQNGGHAHADALSLTFTLRGVPLLIDPGTGCYTVDAALRDRLRSTALHNTLLLDDRPQSTPRGPFQWTHTADAAPRRWRTNPSFDYFEGVHDGYRPLEHRRHVLAMHGDLLIVADLVDGSGSHRAAVHWHVDPRWQVALHHRRVVFSSGTRFAELAVPCGAVEAFQGDDATGLGWHSPAYGRVEPAATLRITHHGSAPLWIVSVFGFDPDNPIAGVEHVPVWAEAGVLAHSAAIRITRAASIDYVAFAHRSDPRAATWRVVEFETDAHLMFCRLNERGQVARVAIVDGSCVRTTGRRRLQLTLPRQRSDLYLDLSRGAASDHAGIVVGD